MPPGLHEPAVTPPHRAMIGEANYVDSDYNIMGI